MTHPVSQYGSQYSAPPLLAPGQWRLSSRWLPWRGGRIALNLAALLMTLLVMGWVAAWLLDAWLARDTDVHHVAAVLIAAVWTVSLWWSITRHARGAGTVMLRWQPAKRGRGVWMLGDAAAQPVVPERVFQCLGWRLYRLTPTDHIPGGKGKVAAEAVWCWVPPLPERDDPADLHRLSCLLTIHGAAFGDLAQSMASSRHEHQQGSVLSTCPPDTDFPDTVCLPERAGRAGRGRAA